MAAFARVRLVMLSGVACSILAACGADGGDAGAGDDLDALDQNLA